jgi:hypothetical protein
LFLLTEAAACGSKPGRQFYVVQKVAHRKLNFGMDLIFILMTLLSLQNPRR